MKEVNLRKCLDDIKNANVIGSSYQNTDQHGNYGVKLYQISKAVVYVEDTGNQINNFLLDEDERLDALTDPDEFLTCCINEWVSNEDDPQLAGYQWGIEAPEENSYDGLGECRILVVGWFYGYKPVHWLKNGSHSAIEFESSLAAQAWIDEEEDGIYLLSRNEAGRPDYYIIEA